MSREDVEGAGSWAGLMTGSDCPEKVATGPRSPGRPGRGQSWKLSLLGAGSPLRSHSEQPRAGHSPGDGLTISLWHHGRHEDQPPLWTCPSQGRLGILFWFPVPARTTQYICSGPQEEALLSGSLHLPLPGTLTVQAAPTGGKPTICGPARSPAPPRGSPPRVTPCGHPDKTLRPDSSMEPAQGPGHQVATSPCTETKLCVCTHTSTHTLMCAHFCMHMCTYSHTCPQSSTHPHSLMCTHFHLHMCTYSDMCP